MKKGLTLLSLLLISLALAGCGNNSGDSYFPAAHYREHHDRQDDVGIQAQEYVQHGSPIQTDTPPSADDTPVNEQPNADDNPANEPAVTEPATDVNDMELGPPIWVVPEDRLVSAASGRSFFIDTRGALWGWGENGHAGLLGDGTTTNRHSPVVILSSNVQAVAAGNRHTLALDALGNVWSWGDASYGRLGDGWRDDVVIGRGPLGGTITVTERRTPTQTGLGWVHTISAGDAHSMAIDFEGRLWGWGSNNHGQVDGSNVRYRRTPIHIMDNIVAVSAGSTHTLALTGDGHLLAWGNSVNLPRAVGVFGAAGSRLVAENVAQIYAGRSRNMFIDNDGVLWGWGSNINNELGLPLERNAYGGFLTIPSHVDTPMQSVLTEVATVSVGAGGTLAIRRDGSVWQLGTFPQRLMDNIMTLSTGTVPPGVATLAIDTHFIAICAIDGHIWTWGQNATGQLGDGTTTARVEPAVISLHGQPQSAVSPKIPFQSIGEIFGRLEYLGIAYDTIMNDGQPAFNITADDVRTIQDNYQRGNSNFLEWSGTYGEIVRTIGGYRFVIHYVIGSFGNPDRCCCFDELVQHLNMAGLYHHLTVAGLPAFFEDYEPILERIVYDDGYIISIAAMGGAVFVATRVYIGWDEFAIVIQSMAG